MRYFKICVRSAAFNVPNDFHPKTILDFKGIPFSTISGLIHVLFGQRPPSRRKQILDFRIPILEKLARASRYKYVRATHEENELTDSRKVEANPKFEGYFGRESAYKDIKKPLVSEELLLTGSGSSFVAALKQVFPKVAAVDSFLEFQKACLIAFDESQEVEPVDRQQALGKLNQLRALEADVNENWRLSNGYLRPFYSKHWVKRSSVFGPPVQLGSGGAPKRKYVFDIDVFCPIPDDVAESEIESLYAMLRTAPATASFGEGGLAWIEALPLDSGRQCFGEALLPIGYVPVTDFKDGLFQKRENA